MANYDSDSSATSDVETGVTLGYASKSPTGDDFSQLGGHPSWLESTSPSGSLAKCKVCNGLLNLLFQLNSDLPEKFPGHERRVYLFGCRRKACRRKEGSLRGLRCTKITKLAESKPLDSKKPVEEPKPKAPQPNLGNALFGVQGSSTAGAASPGSNPFSTSAKPADSPFSASGQAVANPFSASTQAVANPFAPASSLASKPAQKPTTPSPADDLPQTFAEKARISVANDPAPKSSPAPPSEPWPELSAFPEPYPKYYIDADKEYLEPEPAVVPNQTRVDQSMDGEAGGSTTVADAFESSMDKTFQKFADRLAQNPEQVLRYDYGGHPLLYSNKDAVGKAWPRVPRCTCGAERVFELQLTPHAITELEAEDMSLEGMDWGTIILAVCGADCGGSKEEWVGVQWEELTARRQV